MSLPELREAPRKSSQPAANSLNALESAKRRAPRQKDRILHAIDSMRTGATDEEISLFTRIPLNTVRPRRNECAAEGLIVECGTRKTSTNHDATLWRLATTEEREAFEASRAERELNDLAQAADEAWAKYDAIRERYWRAVNERDARRAEVRT